MFEEILITSITYINELDSTLIVHLPLLYLYNDNTSSMRDKNIIYSTYFKQCRVSALVNLFQWHDQRHIHFHYYYFALSHHVKLKLKRKNL
jgi:hypothetical protein